MYGPATNKEASQALKIAIDLGDIDLYKRLLDNFVDLDCVHGFCEFCPGGTVLLYSLHNLQPAIAEHLISSGNTIEGAACQH